MAPETISRTHPSGRETVDSPGSAAAVFGGWARPLPTPSSICPVSGGARSCARDSLSVASVSGTLSDRYFAQFRAD